MFLKFVKIIKATFKYLYEDDMPLFKKIEKIAQEIYSASEVVADTKVRQQLKDFEEKGYGELPICVAKTQYSFSTDPNLKELLLVMCYQSEK